MSTLVSIIVKNMNNRDKIRYFKLAKFLANHGINPPLSGSYKTNTMHWREQGSKQSRFKPNYLEMDDPIYKYFKDVIPLLNKSDKILDVGCNCGRIINYLYELGFRHFTGIELGGKAIEVFETAFPDAYNCTNAIVGLAEKEIKNLPDNHFDLVYTNGVLVNIKKNSIFKDMCRVSKKYILTGESEGSWTAYPRDFEKMFKKHGFEQVFFNWYEWDNVDYSISAYPDMPGVVRYPVKITSDNYLRRHVSRLFVKRDLN